MPTLYLTAAQLELRRWVQDVEQRADKLALACTSTKADWEAHRVLAQRELWLALDRIEEGLGLRMIFALYPNAKERAAAPAPQRLGSIT